VAAVVAEVAEVAVVPEEPAVRRTTRNLDITSIWAGRCRARAPPPPRYLPGYPGALAMTATRARARRRTAVS